MPARSEVSAGVQFNESAAAFKAATGTVNMFLALSEEDLSLAQTLALAFTEGPFIVEDGT